MRAFTFKQVSGRHPLVRGCSPRWWSDDGRMIADDKQLESPAPAVRSERRLEPSQLSSRLLASSLPRSIAHGPAGAIGELDLRPDRESDQCDPPFTLRSAPSRGADLGRAT